MEKQVKDHWDKEMTGRLVSLGIEWEKARMVVGIIAEERQLADRQGYKRGYIDGCDRTSKVFKAGS